MSSPLRIKACGVASQRVALVLCVVSSLLLSGACTRKESALEAWLSLPTGLAADGAGGVFVADRQGHVVHQVDRAGSITTVTGTGEAGSAGDGGPAREAALRSPNDVAGDALGNLYIADSWNHRIRRIDPDGIITTVAGTGEAGFGGDGGAAVEARLSLPFALAVDSSGNLYIADFGNRRIRKVDHSGVITTVAGSGHRGSQGDGGPATRAELSPPTGIAVDAGGTLFIADQFNHRIRRVDPAGIITTLAGTGEEGSRGDAGLGTKARLWYPASVALDEEGNLFIADQENSRIRKLDRAGIITTVAGTGRAGFAGDGGPAAAAQLGFPLGVAIDRQGNLFISDSDNNRIRRVDPSRIITTVAGRELEASAGTEDAGAAAAGPRRAWPAPGQRWAVAGTRFGMSEEEVKALLPDLEWQSEGPLLPSGLAPHIRRFRAAGRSFRGVPGRDLELRFFQGQLYALIFRYGDTPAASVRAALEEQFGKPRLVWKSHTAWTGPRALVSFDPARGAFSITDSRLAVEVDRTLWLKRGLDPSVNPRLDTR